MNEPKSEIYSTITSTSTLTMVKVSKNGMPRPKMRWITHILLILACFFVSIPALLAVRLSTLNLQESFELAPVFLPFGDDLFTNISVLFGAPDPDLQVGGGATSVSAQQGSSHNFARLISNTVIVALVVVIGKTGLSLLAGFAFVYFRFPGKNIVFFFILLTLLMPTEIILTPLRTLMADLNWSGNYPQLALTMPFIASAFGTFLFRQHFSNIPRELAEASQIDGASPLRFFVSILIPMSWNVIMAMALIQFIYMWNQYIWPQVIFNNVNSPDQLIQVGVRRAALSGQNSDFGLLMTAGIIASLPPLFLFVLLQKQFMSGFAITRDK
ncbi:MAG: glycerol-3-phosphate ABC transporter permease [Phototrophicales bacterium]|nr:MAG: glycerol-3-phosphate ABC transporter permease [Phototrophicales bacterium]